MRIFYALIISVISLNAQAQDLKTGKWTAEVAQEFPAPDNYSLIYHLTQCDEGTPHANKNVSVQRLYDGTLKAQLFVPFQSGPEGDIHWHLLDYDDRGVLMYWFDLAQISAREFRGNRWYVGDHYVGRVIFTFTDPEVPNDVEEISIQVCNQPNR